jgi:D-alanine-D-alanine ligase
MQNKSVVLHLCGSRATEYYEGVSTYYASQCFESVITQDTYDHMIAMVHRDGSWSFPSDFSDEAKNSAKHMNIAEACQKILDSNVAVVNPIMFCLPGMTTYRTLFDALEVPLIGNDGPVMALSTNKAQSRAVVAAAGVRVPEAELLREGDRPKMVPPFVLKPCNEDNSMGITLFTGDAGQCLDEALKTAFSFDTEILCERFIPLGRELRCAVLEQDDGTLELLPCIEYFLTKEHPIRASNDKLVTDSRGVPTTLTTGNRQCPADVDSVLLSKLKNLCVQSHRALGCRDYSLYDVRIDPDGEPYFLEACLYCSFAPKSVIVAMSAAKGVGQQQVFEMLVNRAMQRKEKAAQLQLKGLKAS